MEYGSNFLKGPSSFIGTELTCYVTHEKKHMPRAQAAVQRPSKGGKEYPRSVKILIK
jgi:hypothetical protein